MATIPFIFPAVVSGYQNAGYPRHALVRVRGEFELKEFSSIDAPPALQMYDDLYREIDGKLFLKYSPYSYPHDMHYRHARTLSQPETDNTSELNDKFSPEVKCGIFYSLYSGLGYAPAGRPFTGFGQHVADYAAMLSMQDARQVIENITRWQPDRKLREMQIDNEVTRAAMHAPMLRNWRWLSSDAEKEVEHWRTLTQTTFDNLVAIDGDIWFRAPEPRLKVDLGYLRHKGTHPHLLYQSQVHKQDYDHDGFLVMPEGSLVVNRTFFDLDQTEEAKEFIKNIGVNLTASEPEIQIFKPDVLERNTANLERMRIARVVLKSAMWKHNELYENPETSGVKTNSEIVAEFTRSIAGLWDTLLESQDKEDNSASLLPALATVKTSMEDLKRATTPVHDIHQQVSTLLSYIENLHIKEDILPVALPTRTPTTSFHR